MTPETNRLIGTIDKLMDGADDATKVSLQQQKNDLLMVDRPAVIPDGPTSRENILDCLKARSSKKNR